VAAVAAACGGSSTAPSTANIQLVGGTTTPSGVSGLAASIGTGPNDLALWLGNNVHCNPPGSSACTWTFSLQNVGAGCATSVGGVASVYLDAQTLQPNSSASFNVVGEITPGEIFAASASFASVIDGGTIWTVAPTWNSVSCP
jgi:hypothetical protein